MQIDTSVTNIALMLHVCRLFCGFCTPAYGHSTCFNSRLPTADKTHSLCHAGAVIMLLQTQAILDLFLGCMYANSINDLHLIYYITDTWGVKACWFSS